MLKREASLDTRALARLAASYPAGLPIENIFAAAKKEGAPYWQNAVAAELRDEGWTRVRNWTVGSPWYAHRVWIPPAPPLEEGQSLFDEHAAEKLIRQVERDRAPVRRYLVTCAQNNTFAHDGFLKSLHSMASDVGAKLLVQRIRYKNPTSIIPSEVRHAWYDEKLVPFLFANRVRLCKNLEIMGDIPIQPTAENPLVGLGTVTGAHSAIIGHPKLELDSIPTPQQSLPKIFTTTGAVTLPHYVRSKAGKRGEFHHILGACYVEIVGDVFYLFQINADDDGSFYHLNKRYRPDGEIETPGESGTFIEAISLGDEHCEFSDEEVMHAVFLGRDSLVNELRPKQLIRHDIWDFYCQNHHHINEPFIKLAKAKNGWDDVRASIEYCARYIEQTTPQWCSNVVVKSNHPDALAKWVKRSHWQDDPTNAEFLLETALDMVQTVGILGNGASVIDPFANWMKKLLDDQVMARTRFLRDDESHMVCGVETGFHGHYGPNGARGALSSFGKIGVRSVTGHGHSPGIKNGAYRNGVLCRLDLEYNRGPSSWLPANTLIYPNGKRTLSFVIAGDWRARG